MNGLATPRCEFKVTVEVRWFLDVEQAAELLRAMAAAPAEVYFTAEEFNRVVDWIAGDGSSVSVRKPELLSADFNKRIALALRRETSEAEGAKTRAMLRTIFGKSAEAVDRTQTP